MASECRAAVLLAMVQALSVKFGSECLGNEEERYRLASMGPEERFKALQIEFIALAYRLETREMELRESKTKLKETDAECAMLKKLHSVESRQAYEEEVLAKYIDTHAEEVLQMHMVLERDRQKLKSNINADLLQHIPKHQTATLDEILLAAGIKPKDSSNRASIHTVLVEHREKKRCYPSADIEAMVSKIKKFATENPKNFDTVNPVPMKPATLPWESTLGGGKRKHPVDKAWECAMEHSKR